MKPLFPLGQLVATPGAIDWMNDNRVHPSDLIDRHIEGDWGDLDDEDKRMNDHAVQAGNLRILSAYKVGTGEVWVITEADRSSTTILLPEEY